MIEHLIPARRRDLGGFDVARVLPYAQKRMVGPFIFLDHMGPSTWEAGFPRERDVRPHPHIGLATVTYLFEGEITHRDSLGYEQAIHPGEVNWMTAGRGIAHSERFDRLRQTGGRLHGLQAWVALPNALEETAPAFENARGDALPTFEDNGARGRLIAGAVSGVQAGVKTSSPLFYVHWDLPAGARVALPSSAEQNERALYVVDGAVEVAGRRISAMEMAVLGPNADGTIEALEPSIVAVLGGEPVGPRFIWWNFVSSSQERIEQAKADWQNHRFELPPSDRSEWIPLPDPEARRPPANPAS